MATSLGILTDTASAMLGEGVRAAFYLADDESKTLTHIVGMPDEYATAVNGFEIGPESLACGLATHVGKSILTPDVKRDSRWDKWGWLADEFGYRGCWSFPIHTASGRFVGTFAVYWPGPRDAMPQDLERVGIIVQTAAMIIARHLDAERRETDERALQEARSQLESELKDSELLRQLSLELQDEDDENELYQKLVEAAAAILQTEVCTVQVFHPDRGAAGELQMLASIGLPAKGKQFWEWVRADSGCTCGEVLRTGRRAIAEEVATCSFMAGKPDRDELLRNGIQAGQSRPLFSRNGKLIGMISTHWAKPHRPSERALRMLDILARTAADLVERRRAVETQKLLLNELNHRVKNTLVVVQAMAQRTLAKSSDPKVFAESFCGRVQALARAHTMLSEKSWQPADLRQMIGDQILLGSADAGRLTAAGPTVRLDAQSALHMALVLHELGTNATKYGALSVPTGEVSVVWPVGDALRMRWTERGGPQVDLSSAKGFGTTLIAQSVKGQGGEAHMTSEPEGITWRFILPLGAGFVAETESTASKGTVTVVDGKVDARAVEGRRFLVIEDEPLIGLDFVAALEAAGAVVEGPVPTIEQACDLIERQHFDGALLDANLHGCLVDDVATALSRHNVPFAFVTGHNSDALPKEFQTMPIVGKPCQAEQIVEAAARMVAAH